MLREVFQKVAMKVAVREEVKVAIKVVIFLMLLLQFSPSNLLNIKLLVKKTLRNGPMNN